jgi:hypothetical protein
MELSHTNGGLAQRASELFNQLQLYRRYKQLGNEAVNARSWWNARHSGLWEAVENFELEHGHLPKIDFGTFFDWANLAAKSNRRRRSMRDMWKDKTVVCVGNGPSIASTDLTLLNDQYVIGTNRAYMLLDRFRPKAFHLIAQDNYRLQELGPELSKSNYPLHIGNCYFTEQWPIAPWILQTKNRPYIYLPRLNWLETEDSPSGEHLALEADFEPGFSPDPCAGLYYGRTVIFSAIQLAAFFGATKIVCIGIDMTYSNGVNFVSGVTNVFPSFNYEMHAVPMFDVLSTEFNARGIELVNATPGGAVECIKRESLSEALNPSPLRQVHRARAA